MPFEFRNLDETTRERMLQEIRDAIDEERLYFSKRFNENGREAYPGLLLEAAQLYQEHWLAYQLDRMGCFKWQEFRAGRAGGYSLVAVPETAAETLADTEFNRYYMIAVCGLAAEKGKKVVVYRARQRDNPRPESETLIGTFYDPATLAEELKRLPSNDSHQLVQPNTGLSIFLEE